MEVKSSEIKLKITPTYKSEKKQKTKKALNILK